MKLQPDLREFIESLNSQGVRYVIVGGYAVAFHGQPRYTGAIAIFVESSEENARRVEAVLRRFGFADIGLSAEDFLQPESVVQLGVPPNRIDIVTGITGVDFPEAWASKIDAVLDGIPVHFIGKDPLIRNKKAIGRAKDMADIEAIEGEEG